ncbi:MAG: hypothetical protein EOO40_01550 [Deltaproteobacteria bacterium]|nr:MAG: hypothetical protein EOO40_01550 [Deltaproteobacteria bacterium]
MYDTLLAAAAGDMAADFVNSYSRHRSYVHPGDPFGKVVADLWQQDRQRACMFLADYMAEIRNHGRETIEDMPLSRILDGLTNLAWPNWASKEDAEELRRIAPEQVQAYYGDTPLG